MSIHQQFFQITKSGDDQSSFLYCANQRQNCDNIKEIFPIDNDMEMMFHDEAFEYFVVSYREFNII
ncbi:MAG: hypothetical protein Ta2E_08810 [Mycoplasmoidaceae bacterium]|nr:MAG: hypothetical protein Ta2E_08810 [Mycoplasmoidaceae bacterium]